LTVAWRWTAQPLAAELRSTQGGIEARDDLCTACAGPRVEKELMHRRRFPARGGVGRGGPRSRGGGGPVQARGTIFNGKSTAKGGRGGLQELRVHAPSDRSGRLLSLHRSFFSLALRPSWARMVRFRLHVAVVAVVLASFFFPGQSAAAAVKGSARRRTGAQERGCPRRRVERRRR